jgi:thiol-disulfide isomerase/thioredoxin
MNKVFQFLSAVIVLTACQYEGEVMETENELAEHQHTVWRGVINLNDSIDLPFNFNWEMDGEQPKMTIRNGEENVVSTEILTKDDSTKVYFPAFANYFVFKKHESRMFGFYINPDAKNYKLPFTALSGDSTRFKSNEKNCCDINKKWAVKFSPNTEDEYPAIGYFKQKGKDVTGTFVTETGDYRYLEGVLSGNRLQLSTFDGAHAFVFTAKLKEGDRMEGKFYSGPRWQEPWLAYRDDSFELSDPDSLTFLKEGFDKLSFRFPDKDGNQISLEDDRFKDKPVIVQIMGSWCPRYLKQVYQKYNAQGLEIISLAFERSKNTEVAFKRVAKLKKDLELPYPILLAGSSNKIEAAKSLPMLNHILSFPTAIYLNRAHEIEKIHTGFYGPGTPLYDSYVSENKLLLDRLVGEEKQEENL